MRVRYMGHSESNIGRWERGEGRGRRRGGGQGECVNVRGGEQNVTCVAAEWRQQVPGDVRAGCIGS